MKNLILKFLVKLFLVAATVGGASLENKADKEVGKAHISRLETSLNEKESQENTPVIEPATPVPCEPQIIRDTIKTKCEDCSKLVALAVKKAMEDCPVCVIPKLEIFRYGYVDNHKLFEVITNLGVDCTEVVTIRVEPSKGK